MFFVSLSANENVLPMQGEACGIAINHFGPRIHSTHRFPSLARSALADPNSSRQSSFSLSGGSTSEDIRIKPTIRAVGKKKNLVKSFLEFFASKGGDMLPQSARDAGFGKNI